MNLHRDLGLRGRLRENEPLRGHTSFRIGGPARFFFSPEDRADLARILSFCRKQGETVRVIGAGTNILAADSPISGITIRLDRSSFRRIEQHGRSLSVGAGCTLAAMLGFCREKLMTGAEFLAGIPGTLGGALTMNAGIREGGSVRSIADLVENVSVMDYNGTEKLLSRRQAGFGYRQSRLRRLVILGARLRFSPGSPELIQERIVRYVRSRSALDYSLPSAGCVFKNPAGDSAGRLIDACGLKGTSRGGAVVSARHANFIMNAGGASARDVLCLMRSVRRHVRERFGVVLEPEIRIWK